MNINALWISCGHHYNCLTTLEAVTDWVRLPAKHNHMGHGLMYLITQVAKPNSANYRLYKTDRNAMIHNKKVLQHATNDHQCPKLECLIHWELIINLDAGDILNLGFTLQLGPFYFGFLKFLNEYPVLFFNITESLLYSNFLAMLNDPCK